MANDPTTQLNTSDIQTLTKPFAIRDHGMRVGEKGKEGKFVMWLFYVEEEPLVDRLNEVDPAWTFEIINEQMTPKFAKATMRLTLKGAFRDNVGTNSPFAGEPGENEVKGCYTDALKRCARLFGVGLYLKGLARVYTDGADTGKDAQQKAWTKFEKVYRDAFSTAPQPHPTLPTPAQTLNAPEVPSGNDPNGVMEYLGGNAPVPQTFLADGDNRSKMYKFTGAVLNNAKIKAEAKDVLSTALATATGEPYELADYTLNEDQVKAAVLAFVADYNAERVAAIAPRTASEIVLGKAKTLCKKLREAA